jgi:hypothetical protein
MIELFVELIELPAELIKKPAGHLKISIKILDLSQTTSSPKPNIP